MTENSYRIRTNVGEEPSVLNVKLNQTFDTLEILSLKISQEDTYKLYKSNYGVVVGRVLANGGVGIPNAKVSIFIEAEGDQTLNEKILYSFNSVRDTNNEGVRYNLLPESVDDACYQNVGTFPTKRLVLDNNDVIEVFEKYYKYTTSTNQSGDYMIVNVPIGNQQVHVDVDLSDIGFLSQRPRDMMYKGSPSDLFESPNKFKTDTNLDSLVQLYTQNIGLYVFPFWGDTTEDDTIAITRCDIQIQYKFEPTCVFMGSAIGDNDGHIGCDCTPSKNAGVMSNIVASQGTIEMIRKTPEGKIEEFSIKGNRLIDENGVWCYQIPMNLDYVTTDEFGNMVATDDTERGIPTRASVRFRITLDDEIGNVSSFKRCSYLVPNNPRLNEDYSSFRETKLVDYDFGSNTKDEDFRDMFWNKVYTVKNFIPRLQTNTSSKEKKYSGIKAINHGGNINRFPYNGLFIKLTFSFRLICVITKFIVYMIAFLNNIISLLINPFCNLCKAFEKLTKIPLVGSAFKPIKNLFCGIMIDCIRLGSDFCDDGQNKYIFLPGCKWCVWDKMKEKHKKTKEYLNGWVLSNQPGSLLEMFGASGGEDDIPLMTCIENALAQEDEATSYNFYNDWVNGTLYFPKWYRRITPKKKFLFGLFKKKAKDQWCSAEKRTDTKYLQHCAVTPQPNSKECKNKCHESMSYLGINYGIVVTKETMLKQTVYYYKSVNYDSSINDVLLLYATDIVLLGSLNENDIDGTPQFFKYLPLTTYQLPNDILDVNTEVKKVMNADGIIEDAVESINVNVEASGQDWGNTNNELCGKSTDGDGGLFYGIGCSSIDVKAKSCINLRRLCELGVSLDTTKEIPSYNMKENDSEEDYKRLVADGFVSYDEIYGEEMRAMFATMNNNNLKTELNQQTGYPQYYFNYLYPTNFDGALATLMTERQKKCNGYTYKDNYKLENKSNDYVEFRMGKRPFYYDSEKTMPRYENSYYFYFGVKPGSTAIEKFNTSFFSDCENKKEVFNSYKVTFKANDWCDDNVEQNRKGYIKLDLTGISTPYSIICKKVNDVNEYKFTNINYEKVYIGQGDLDNSEIEGYNQLQDDNGNDVALENGEWEISIRENGGEIETYNISFKPNLLTCNVVADEFIINCNELYNENGNENEIPYKYSSYTNVANNNESFELNHNTQLKDRKIGGLIKVYDIYSNNVNLTENEKVCIEIQSVDNILDDSENTIILNDGTKPFTTSNNEENVGYLGEESGVFYFGVPLPNRRYIVTVTQLCDNNKTNNVFSTVIYVSEPSPFNFIINDIDYEIIKNFKSGYSDEGFNDNDIKGWTELSKIQPSTIIDTTEYNNETYESIEEKYIQPLEIGYNGTNICPYNWTEKYCYDSVYYYDLKTELINCYYINNIGEITLKQWLDGDINNIKKPNSKKYEFAYDSSGNKYKAYIAIGGGLFQTDDGTYCDEEGYVYDTDENELPYKLFNEKGEQLKVFYDEEKKFYYEYGEPKKMVRCDKRGYVYDTDENELPYKVYKLREDAFYEYLDGTYCDEEGYVYDTDENELPYKLFNEKGEQLKVFYDEEKKFYYEYGEPKKMVRCDKRGYVYDTDENELPYKVYKLREDAFYEYLDGTYCDEEGYVYDTNMTINEKIQNLCEEVKSIINDINDVINTRLEFVSLVKENFYIYDMTYNQRLTLSTTTKLLPVMYKVCYQPEIEDGDNEIIYLEKDDYTITNEISGLDVYLPTLTKGDNNLIQYVDIKGKKKKPYIVGIKNSHNITIPINITTNEWENVNKNKFFHVHFIDKVFKASYCVLAGHAALPIHTGNMGDVWNEGEYKLLDAVLYEGEIQNGFVETIPIGQSSGNTQFKTQVIGNYELIITTNTDEDAIPTIRQIEGYKENQNAPTNTYYFDGDNSRPIIIPTREVDLEIEDTKTTLLYTLYGSMSFLLTNNSIHGKRNESNTIEYEIINGDGNETVYVFQCDNNNNTIYPYSTAFSETVFNQKYFNDLINECIKNKNIKILKENGSTEVLSKTNLHGSSGTLVGFEENKQYFLVAKTENNCYAVSPIYDFTLDEITLKVIQHTHTYTNGDKCYFYSLSVNYGRKTSAYYRKYDDKNITLIEKGLSDVESSLTSQIKFNEKYTNIDIKSIENEEIKNDLAYNFLNENENYKNYEANEDIYNALKSLYDNSNKKKKNCYVGYKDVSGLCHYYYGLTTGNESV